MPSAVWTKGNIAPCAVAGQNPENCFGLVSCFAFPTSDLTTRNHHNIFKYRMMWRFLHVKAKGNIHPLTDASPHVQDVFSGEKHTVATAKTSQTERIVSRISSAQSVICYQRKFSLPVSDRVR